MLPPDPDGPYPYAGELELPHRGYLSDGPGMFIGSGRAVA